AGHDQARVEPNQLLGEQRQAGYVAVGVARLERIVTAFQVTKLSHALWKAVVKPHARRFRGRRKKTDERLLRRSLCRCPERRRHRRATKQRDELAPLHWSNRSDPHPKLDCSISNWQQSVSREVCLESAARQ